MQESWLKPLNPYKFKQTGAGEYSDTAKIMQELGVELDFVNKKSDALGISMGKHRQLFDVARAKVSVYSKALEDLLDPKVKRGPSWQANVDIAIEGLEKMQKEFEKIQTKRDFLNGIQDSFTSFFSNIIGGTKSVAGAFKEMTNSILQSFAKMVGEMIAKKIMGLLLNLLSGGIGGTAINAAKAVGLNMIGFAQGGTVPPGYPNDSYPAALTSGERVIPAGSAGGMKLELEPVRLTLSQYDLKGWIRKSNKQSNLY
jgi:hypothetical protein